MENSGKILLLSGGCQGGACIVFIMDGQGDTGDESTDDTMTAVSTGTPSVYAAIPEMTRFYGKWGIGIGIAFLGEAGGGGTFDVTRVD